MLICVKLFSGQGISSHIIILTPLTMPTIVLLETCVSVFQNSGTEKVEINSCDKSYGKYFQLSKQML